MALSAIPAGVKIKSITISYNQDTDIWDIAAETVLRNGEDTQPFNTHTSGSQGVVTSETGLNILISNMSDAFDLFTGA